jgi:hypothetical protein
VPRHRLRTLRLPVLALLLALVPAPAAAEPIGTVQLVPDDQANWRPSRLLAWLRPGHNYGERAITVETTPPGAKLDLFYIRANFQKRYERAEAPVKVVLPPRVEAGPRDAVNIRAYQEGYRQREVSLRVSSSRDHVHIELDPLPNTLVAVSHVYLAGRASLAFLTKEPLQVRVQERDDGFNVILAETARGPEVAAGVDTLRSPRVEKVEALQLGEDLLVQVDAELGEGVELRSRQSRDELRDLHVYSVEMVPADGGVAAVQEARAALAAIGPEDVSGCAAVFDETLREALDPAALARALAPNGTFTDPYLRAAMKRLGEVSAGGRIAMVDGARYDPASGIELAAALSQPADAKGYLALLRAFVRRMEPAPHRTETLRGIVAPEMGTAAFASALARAEAAEARCRGGGV